MTQKFVLLNGPPRCGKSTTARLIKDKYPDTLVVGFSYHLKRFVHGIYLGKRGWNFDPDVFDSVKNEPQSFLDDKSWRQMYIHYSENVIKPLHSKYWFGEQLVRIAKQSNASLIAVPDCGFVEEAETVVRFADPGNVVLVHMYREGCTFKNDSRSYINLDHMNVPTIRIHNEEGPNWQATLLEVLDDIVDRL